MKKPDPQHPDTGDLALASAPKGRPTDTRSGETASMSTGGLLTALEKDLRNGTLEIPGFPDIAMRLNRALNNPDAAIPDIVRLINSEPGLVSRLLKLSNSAAFSAGREPVADLKAAVRRLGFRNVWTAAGSYSIQQLQQHAWLKPMRPWLAEIWLSSNAVAAICAVVARKVGHLSDEALVAGLLHRVGDLYLLTHAQKRGIDIRNDDAWDRVIEKWHATIAGSMVQQWGLPQHVVTAISSQDAIAKGDTIDIKPFTTLLSAAKLYNSVRHQQRGERAEEVAALLEPVEVWGRPFLKLVAEGHAEIEALRTSIS